MFRFKCTPTFCCTAIAIWTIIQTGLHIYAIFYLMWWRDCNEDKNANNILYLNYFFTKECENETGHTLEHRRLAVTVLHTNLTNHTTLNSTLDEMMLSYMILDALWIVAAVALLVGALFDIREIWALLFYLPWTVIAGVIVFFDVFCSIFFGLQIPKEGNIFDWLNLIGFNIHLTNINKLEGDMGSLVTGAASVIMTVVAARGIIIWVINLLVMIYIIRITIRVVKYKPRSRVTKRFPSFSAEERIRKWHQFYGSTDGRRGRRRPPHQVNIFNINEDARSINEDARTINEDARSINEDVSINSSVRPDGSQISNKASSSRSVMSPQCRKKIEQISLSELRGQLPWSYVDGTRAPETMNAEVRVEAMRPDVVPKRHYVNLSDIDNIESVSRF